MKRVGQTRQPQRLLDVLVRKEVNGAAQVDLRI